MIVKPELSLIMPAYNEEDKIDLVIERVDSLARRMKLSYELIVVDDGSVDETRLKVDKYAKINDHVKVVGLENNMGKGFAIKTGFLNATGDAVVFIDSDLDVDVEQVSRYIDALKENDIAVGSKWHKESVVEVSKRRKLLSHGFNILVRLFTGVNLNDTQTGLKAVRREVFEEVFKRLSIKRYAFDVELLVLTRIFGLRVIELPVQLKLNNSFRLYEVCRMLFDLLSITYRLRIKKGYMRDVSEVSSVREVLSHYAVAGEDEENADIFSVPEILNYSTQNTELKDTND